MTSLTLFSSIASALYLISGIGIVSAMREGAGARASTYWRWVILLGVLFHGYGIQGEIFNPSAANFGPAYAMSVMFFFAVVILLVESLVHRLHGQFGIILIVASLGTVMPILLPETMRLSAGGPIDTTQWTTLFRWHILLALAAYSLMTIAFVHAILMALQNRRLKHIESVSQNFLDSMPGLVVMERVFFRIVAVGFIFLTLVLITGAFSTHQLFDTWLRWDHKTILTTISWIIFGVLLLGRYLCGWRARTALTWFWTGFVVFAIAYFGYSFIKLL